MKIDYVLVSFENVKFPARYAEKIRGYFGNKYIENSLIHNHSNNKFLYGYPLIQYKVVKNIPYICAVNEGTTTLLSLALNDDYLIIEGEKINIYQKQIIKDKVEFGITDDYITYDFVSPWIALNQENIKLYEASNNIAKEEILKKILIGNMISMSKGLGYTVDKQIYVWLDLKEISVKFKNISMSAFVGKFKTNFHIPNYLGLGKSVSRGFGTIKKV